MMILYIHYYSRSWDPESRTSYKMILKDFYPLFVMMMMRCDMMKGGDGATSADIGRVRQ